MTLGITFREHQPVRARNNTITWVCWCNRCNMCLTTKESKYHNCSQKFGRDG